MSFLSSFVPPPSLTSLPVLSLSRLLAPLPSLSLPPCASFAGGAAGKAARTGAGAAKLVCAVCKTEVSATAPLKLLTEHTDSKHAKLADAVKVCFPTWVAPA